jgi:hypothetical protein
MSYPLIHILMKICEYTGVGRVLEENIETEK